jgi:DNA-binding FrmR family transcriptional regulator
MVTLRQLKLERKRAFRAVLKNLNPSEKALNELHREIVRRLTKHNVELLDVEDATRIIEMSQVYYDEVKKYAMACSLNLGSFFI